NVCSGKNSAITVGVIERTGAFPKLFEQWIRDTYPAVALHGVEQRCQVVGVDPIVTIDAAHVGHVSVSEDVESVPLGVARVLPLAEVDVVILDAGEFADNIPRAVCAAIVNN